MKIVVNGVLMARHGLILRQRGATAFLDHLEAFPDPKSIIFGPMLAQNVGFAWLQGLRGQKVKKQKMSEKRFLFSVDSANPKSNSLLSSIPLLKLPIQ